MHRQNLLRILLIEDRTVAAITLECLLEDLGHTVVAVAATPPQAERALLRHMGAIDLVIFDALIVGLPSLGIAEQLAERHLPHLVTSTMPEADLRALGFDAPYLAQPFTDVGVAQALSAFESMDSLSAA